MKKLQIWGGLECTLNRVGDLYFNQCTLNGHDKRISDLALFKSLGIKKLRYPCLWELVAPERLDQCDWTYLDERLEELKKLNLDFIAGFLHHGSGPRYTSLIDPDFPSKFATYAEKFAQRYPWVNDFTPINEINTTARFSLLYGHWYPHEKNERQYLRGLIQQCKATVLAMQKIRRINPMARLIQTDDLGKCQSTEKLIYQREFENERRWLAWDLLCGMVGKNHPLFEWLTTRGILESELDWFKLTPCHPDVIGINHYHLSNRYLDHRLELFPESFHGGNGLDSYVDVGAIDTGLVNPVPLETIIRETWDRFGKKIAITECHTRGYRESQIRWLKQVWTSCKKLLQEGIDIEAVTAWSLLGTYNWNNLCTQNENYYEPGVFDLHNPEAEPRSTAISEMIKSLADDGEELHPVSVSEGPWETGRRILFNAQIGQFSSIIPAVGSRPLLIIGSTGTLGQAFARICGERNIHYRLIGRGDVDLKRLETIESLIHSHYPWGIVNATGYVRVDEAEDDPVSCFDVNVVGAKNIAIVAREMRLSLVTFSSDLVFNGNSQKPYTELDEVSPINIYGKSKAMCEETIRSSYPESLIIRTSSFFGPWDQHNFITKTLIHLGQGEEVIVPNDMYISPTYVPDLVNETLTLLIDGESGIFHLTNVGEMSWEEFALRAVDLSKNPLLKKELIISKKSIEMGLRAPRPRRSSLSSLKQNRLPDIETAIRNYFRDLKLPI